MNYVHFNERFVQRPTQNLRTLLMLSAGMVFTGMLTFFFSGGMGYKSFGLLSTLAGLAVFHQLRKYIFIISGREVDESQFVPFDNAFLGSVVVPGGKRELTSIEYERFDLENTHYATKLKTKQLLESKGALTVLDAVNLTLYDKLTQQPINRRKEEQLAKSEIKKRLVNFRDNKK